MLFIGVSEWTAEHLRAGQELATGLGFRILSNQAKYSMLWRVIEPEVVPASVDLGISQIVWSPVAQGVLSGKYLPGQPVPEGPRATDTPCGTPFIKEWLRDDVVRRVQDLQPVAQELGLTLAQLAIAWALQNPHVSAALIGASRPEQVAENVKASGVKVPHELRACIDEILGDVIERDPAKTSENAPSSRPAWGG